MEKLTEYVSIIDDEKEIYLFKFVEKGTLHHYSFDSHKRARNWVAILNGKNSVKLEMKFLSLSRHGYFDIGDLKEGNALELGADYFSGSGIRKPDRRQFVVLEVKKDEIIMKRYPSRATAMKNRFNQAKDTA